MRKLIWIAVALAVMTTACRKAETPAAGTQAGAAEKPAAVTATTAAAPSGTDVGAVMPPYTAKNLDGSSFDLASEKGNVVLLNVWATWCPPCRAEIPELQKLHDQYTAKKFKVIGVSVDEGNGDDVRKFVTEQKMTYPVALDPEGRIATMLQTSYLPTTVVLDRTGRIVFKKTGQIDFGDNALQAALTKAMGS